MQNPWLELRRSIVSAVKTAHQVDISDILEEPGKEGFGDFALPCFKLAARLKQDPVKLAQSMAQVPIPSLSSKAQGPYINWYVDWKAFAPGLVNSVDNFYGRQKYAGKFALVEFSSPNPAHPFHMGTVRSTIIGESVSRILDSRGFDVKRLCYMNDLGRQANILLLGYLQKHKGKEPKGKPDVWLGKIYFSVNKQLEEDPKLNEKVEALIRENEKQNKETWPAAKKVFGWCVDGFQQDWKMMGIKFDRLVWESSFVKDSKQIIRELEQRKLVFESEGALVLNLEPHGLPSTIIQRSDGTGLYLTRDLAHALYKFNEYKPEISIYVVGEDQRLHFQQMFKTLRLIGLENIADKSVHLAYSMVLLEGKKMSSRKGRVVLWDELLKEGLEKAEKEVQKRWPKLSATDKKKRAKSIALAAIIYYVLKHGAEKPVDFHWDSALRFEGDTGPYLQYTHARCASILRKAKPKKGKPLKAYDGGLKEAAEIALLRLLAQYPQVLAKASRDLRPHYVCGYLFSLADAFNKFYEAVPVLKAEDEAVLLSRLKLVEAVKHVIASGLDVLGIEAPERM
jgi:arginyl-tRNA synthetase